MARLNAKQLQKEFEENLPKRKEANYARDLQKQKRKALLEDEKKEFQKELDTQTETGSEAEKRLLKELKTLRGNISTTSGQPLYPGDFPDPEIIEMQRKTVRGNQDARSSYYSSPDYTDLRIGNPGTPSRIANERMNEIRRDIKTSKRATERGVPFAQQQRVRDVEDKQKEFRKIFERPGIDPKRVKYLIREATKNYIMQKYGTGE